MTAKRVLVTGSTGYVGGRLVPRLLDAGHSVRVLVRSPQKLTDVPWADQVEIVEGTLQDTDAMRRASQDIDVVYYLVHSMTGRGDFETEERDAAESVASAAVEAGVSRIIYLGGLHPDYG